jgi:antitoxin CptB
MPGDNSKDETTDLDARRRRIVWRASHRGTKEMDLMLGRFAAAKVSTFEESELAAFEDLLARPDPDLSEELLSRTTRSGDRLISSIRRFHGLED